MTDEPTPDEYHYAAAHLRAAIDHIKLALHYAGEDQVAMDELALVTLPDFVLPAYRHCADKADPQ